MSDAAPLISGRSLGKRLRRDRRTFVQALDAISIEVGSGSLTALVGPDGAGKTTLLRLVAGLMRPDAGQLRVLGLDVTREPQQIQSRIGYMPQKFGLYEDLSVQENLDLYAALYGMTAEAKARALPRLMAMTDLGRFTDRLAGQLSGGMKQKLGLACTLVRSPELLLLDEPTVGVDPLSRRELWQIILRLIADTGLTVLMTTAYLDEAEHCSHVVVMHDGRMLAQGGPGEIRRLAAGRVFRVSPPPGQPARVLQARLLDRPDIADAVPEGGAVRVVFRQAVTSAGASISGGSGRLSAAPAEPRFEDGFMSLLHQRRLADAPRHADAAADFPSAGPPGKTVIEVNSLVRRFGAFTAVDHVSFSVRKGEIFGLLGPNGAGKTTTFRMLCGLLPPTEGTLRVAGEDLRLAPASARRKIGYVAQKFALYGQLSVNENLAFFASAYGLRGRRRRQRIDWALEHFDLAAMARLASGLLPGGYKQRLAMATALLHEPETLFLDEPTSGADPLARREFWRRITALAEQGVTVVITTHFMEEAEYCDRAMIQDAGKMLMLGTPDEIRAMAAPARVAAGGVQGTMEDAFIAIVEAARAGVPIAGAST